MSYELVLICVGILGGYGLRVGVENLIFLASLFRKWRRTKATQKLKRELFTDLKNDIL